MDTTIVYSGCIGIMEKKMETAIVYSGYIEMMEKKMETTIVYWGYLQASRLGLQPLCSVLGADTCAASMIKSRLERGKLSMILSLSPEQ